MVRALTTACASLPTASVTMDSASVRMIPSTTRDSAVSISHLFAGVIMLTPRSDLVVAVHQCHSPPENSFVYSYLLFQPANTEIA